MISVIIPTADRPGPLHRALRSLARQTYRDFEVVIVRDGGLPTRAVVDSWTGNLRLTFIDLNERSGVSAARNRGLAAASGQYVAFLDDDDIFFPEHLALAHRSLASGDADLVYGGALVSPRWMETHPRSTQGLPRKDYLFDDGFLLVANFIHTGSIVARNFTDTPIRFNEDLVHCEDWDMWLALRRTLGYHFASLRELTCIYHQVPHARGAVSDAYLTSPTPFTLARARQYATWPATDPHIANYRTWFSQFDRRLDHHIERALPIPDHVYEHAVRGLHQLFTAGAPADPALLDALLPALAHTTGHDHRPEEVVHAAP